MQIKNYINGELVEPISNKYIENINPATGEVYSYLPDSDSRDVNKAVQAASEAFNSWSRKSAQERSQILLKIADLIEKNLDKLALAETTDNGKPLKLSKKVDIPRAVENFRFFATGIIHFASESHYQPHFLNYTLRMPLGVVGCISPWNLPLYLFTWKVAPALAAGNCVVAKPSEITPMTAYLLAELCIEAGLPRGVMNIVHGYGSTVGTAITQHPSIRAISFTGGTKTGQEIARVAAPMFKKLSLELGGKNATLVFADCDLERTIHETVSASFSNQGQICLCGSRIFVEQSIYEVFVQKFVERTKKLIVADPLDERANLGAVVSKSHYEKILSYIDLAQEEGGKILYGGKEKPVVNQRCEKGYFVYPTVITGLDAYCRTNQEEIFGPVVTIQPFDTEEEAIIFANSTQYGLAGSIWTQNLARAHRVAQAVESGILWVNCWLIRDLRTPFGGMKQSGVGREGGWEALRFFTEPKNICIQI
ncbi:MAG: aldehyde dehydrogenase [Bacteroidia bacterium]|nr:aldehyde dehydrogenase [Bacteroidia bacterium]MDW8348102.1 aldehyde dehydrogenase [Bacteroidia bacterium]